MVHDDLGAFVCEDDRCVPRVPHISFSGSLRCLHFVFPYREKKIEDKILPSHQKIKIS